MRERDLKERMRIIKLMCHLTKMKNKRQKK